MLRRRTTSGYQLLNQPAPAKAATDATMSIQSGTAGSHSAAASAATSTANAPAQILLMMTLVVKNTGIAQMGSGTRSRAYWRVKGWPMASETSTMARRPASTARRTVATDQGGGHRPRQAR